MSHNPTTRKVRCCWGFSAIRAIDQDDPQAVLRAFRLPFADVNATVDRGLYGDYVFTLRMDLHAGDTALHLALRWRKMQAVKALLHLGARWDVPNACGMTADAMLGKHWLKPMALLKVQQEREYEAAAMAQEEASTRRFLAWEAGAQQAAAARKAKLLREARTRGTAAEAIALLWRGRYLAPQHDARPDVWWASAGEALRHMCRALNFERAEDGKFGGTAAAAAARHAKSPPLSPAAVAAAARGISRRVKHEKPAHDVTPGRAAEADDASATGGGGGGGDTVSEGEREGGVAVLAPLCEESARLRRQRRGVGRTLDRMRRRQRPASPQRAAEVKVTPLQQEQQQHAAMPAAPPEAVTPGTSSLERWAVAQASQPAAGKAAEARDGAPLSPQQAATAAAAAAAQAAAQWPLYVSRRKSLRDLVRRVLSPRAPPLRRLSVLHELKYDAALSSEDVRCLAAVVQRSPALSHLCLARRHVCDAQLRVLADALLAAEHHLEWLDLEGNCVTDAGAAVLLSTLQRGLRVSELCVSRNFIGAGAVAELAAVQAERGHVLVSVGQACWCRRLSGSLYVPGACMLAAV